MSSEEEDILSKMDALLKRHQPSEPAVVEIPTLTEVVVPPESNNPAPIPILTEIVQATPAVITESVPEPAEPEITSPQPAPETVQHDDVSKAIATLVNDWLDRNMPAKLDQLTGYIEQMVHETVAKELQTHLESLAEDYAKMLRNPASDKAPPDPENKGDSV